MILPFQRQHRSMSLTVTFYCASVASLDHDGKSAKREMGRVLGGFRENAQSWICILIIANLHNRKKQNRMTGPKVRTFVESQCQCVKKR